MSEDELEQNDDQSGGGGDAGDGAADETYGDEAGVDSAFVVTGEKQPLSKGTVVMFVILEAGKVST